MQPVHSKRLFESAVCDHYWKVLVSVTLCSDTLYSALLRYVHGYARVHTSIVYISATALLASAVGVTGGLPRLSC